MNACDVLCSATSPYFNTMHILWIQKESWTNVSDVHSSNRRKRIWEVKIKIKKNKKQKKKGHAAAVEEISAASAPLLENMKKTQFLSAGASHPSDSLTHLLKFILWSAPTQDATRNTEGTRPLLFFVFLAVLTNKKPCVNFANNFPFAELQSRCRCTGGNLETLCGDLMGKSEWTVSRTECQTTFSFIYISRIRSGLGAFCTIKEKPADSSRAAWSDSQQEKLPGGKKPRADSNSGRQTSSSYSNFK